jgi:predicted RNA binding protein YcfA (HicA-like mRNA interferase family)
MSSELPIITTREIVRAFSKAGYALVPGRGKGSHVALVSPDGHHLLIIPNHGDVKRGTLRALIRQAGMTVNEFRELL